MPNLPPRAIFDQALAAHQNGQLQIAEQLYRQFQRTNPNDPDTLHLLGVCIHQLGRSQQAIELITAAISLSPNDARYHNNLGEVLRALDRHDDALAKYRSAVRLNPNFAQAWYNIGLTHAELTQHEQALDSFQKAAALQPNYFSAIVGAGIALSHLGRHEQACEAFRTVIRARPDSAAAYHNLANLLYEHGDLAPAIHSYRAAVSLNSSDASSQLGLANALARQGNIDAAVAAYRQAIALDPGNHHLHSAYLFTLNFDPKCSPALLLHEHKDWAAKHAAPFAAHRARPANDRSSTRRLRIGYVSPDFRNHPITYFIEPVLENHDLEQVEIFCYADVARPDDVTRRLQKLPIQWRNTLDQPHLQFIRQVRQDQIDILIDLAVHTGYNRLPAFAAKPTPLQMTYLGYPATTGLDAVDYKLSDPILDPPGQTEAWHTEQILRLPHYFCYRPDPRSPDVSPLPCLTADHITFGSSQSLIKISDAVVQTWSRLLHALPSARLILQAPGLHDDLTRQATLARFAIHGIGGDRLVLNGYQPFLEYLALLNRIDISLDTFPYSSGTTTCHNLWMGLPVIACAGATAVSRMSTSVLASVGLEELSVDMPDAYIALAVDFANDTARLTELRRTMRERLTQSPLLDAPGFTRALESAYRQAWTTWCAST